MTVLAAAGSLHAALKAVATNTFSAAILDGMTGWSCSSGSARPAFPTWSIRDKRRPLERQLRTSTNRRAVTPEIYRAIGNKTEPRRI
jgi:hypothetical protein